MASRTATILELCPAIAAAAVATVAVLSAGHADADPNADFLGQLSDAGIDDAKQADITHLGHSVCQTMGQPGNTFGSAVTTVQENGVAPDMAGIFASLAIHAYCPSMTSSIAEGNVFTNLVGPDGTTAPTGQ